MGIEVLLEVKGARHFHLGLQSLQIVAVRLATLLKLPSEATLHVWSLHHVVIVVDEEQLVDDELVLGNVGVVERVDVVQDVSHLLDAPGYDMALHIR